MYVRKVDLMNFLISGSLCVCFKSSKSELGLVKSTRLVQREFMSWWWDENHLPTALRRFITDFYSFSLYWNYIIKYIAYNNHLVPFLESFCGYTWSEWKIGFQFYLLAEVYIVAKHIFVVGRMCQYPCQR